MILAMIPARMESQRLKQKNLCELVALWDSDRPRLGVIASIFSDEVFNGGPELGCQLNGKTVAVSEVSDVSQAIRKFRGGGCFEEIWANSEDQELGAIAEKEGVRFHIAAGLALVEGAGEAFRLTPGSGVHRVNALAWSGHLLVESIIPS